MRTLAVVCAVLALSVSAPGQFWTGPYPIASDSSDEINPSACKEWVYDDITCMAWQTNKNGNWDVCAAFCDFRNGNGWQPVETLTTSYLNDVNPSVVVSGYNSYWCFWERRPGPHVGEIWGSHSDGDSWDEPVLIGRSLHGAPVDSSEPCGISVYETEPETTWVIWNNRDTSGSYISYALHDGDSWTTPGIVTSTAHETRHARIGRVSYYRGGWYNGPMVVWKQQDDIWCSEFRDGQWTQPESVAPHQARDCAPEVLSHSSGGGGVDCGVVWQSERDGDSAIYGVSADSLRAPFRLCDSTGGRYANWSPQAVEIAFPAEWWTTTTVWVTNRNGNPDIYCTDFVDRDAYIDTHPSIDLHPAVTTMGLVQSWCCWQTDRNGNWDIYGSYVYGTGIGGKDKVVRTKDEVLTPSILSRAALLSRLQHDPDFALFDASGRAVFNPKTGIYFLQRKAVNGKRQAALKVLVTD